MRTPAIMIAALLLLAGRPTAADSVTDAPPRPFVIVAEELPPYEYLDENGKPEGINVEIIDRIFKDLQIPYEIRFYPWSRAWMMLENGAADAVFSVSYAKDREPYLYFTPEQSLFWETGTIPPDFLWVTEFVFFVNKKLAPSVRFNSYEQLKAEGIRAAVVDEYSYNPAFLNSGIQMVKKSTPKSALQTLLNGEADLLPMDRHAGWALLQTEKLHDKITWLPKPLFSKPYLLGVSRQSNYPGAEGLTRRFYDRLNALRHSGEVDKIIATHLDPFRPVRSSRPVFFVCEEWRPFEYLENNQMKGINVDLVARIMGNLRIPHEIRAYPWARAWMMAEQGQAEAVVSVSYHPDREKVLLYTDGQREAAKRGVLPKDYLWISRYAFYVKNNKANGCQLDSYDTMIESGCRVGLNKGYSYSPTFPANRFKSTLYYDTQAGFMGLIKEEIDAYPMDITVGRHTLQEMGIADSVTQLPKVLFSKAYLAAFTRTSDYPQLESIMYEFYHELRQLRAAGAVSY